MVAITIPGRDTILRLWLDSQGPRRFWRRRAAENEAEITGERRRQIDQRQQDRLPVKSIG